MSIEADELVLVEAGFDAIARVHRLMSAHAPDSELSQVNRFAHQRSVPISTETREVLARAQSLARYSGGLFDVVAAGARAIADGRLPRHPDQPIPEATDWRELLFNEDGVRLAVPGCIDLGGIAKGFAVDQAVAAMRSAGAARGLVNAGGDLRGFGVDSWPVTVAHPRTGQPLIEVAVRNAALATSALLGDGSHNHLAGRADYLSVTVRAANACDADALTKIVWADAAGAAPILERFGASGFGICRGHEVVPIMAPRRAA